MISSNIKNNNPSPPEWWVFMGIAGTISNVIYLACPESKIYGKILNATAEEVERASGDAVLKYKYTGDESRIEIDAPAPRLSVPEEDPDSVALERKWWTIGSITLEGSPERTSIILLCELTDAIGHVFEYTNEELNRARAMRGTGDRWEDNLRAHILSESSSEIRSWLTSTLFD